MQLIDGRPVYAATDLVGFLACEHLTALERAALEHLVARPDRPDRELDVIRRRGEQHERRYLEQLRAAGKRIVAIERRDNEERGHQVRRQAAETVQAMRLGADVVYQATFFDGRWLGYADFLLRVDDPSRPSAFGDWHYEVADTKLARHVKAGAVLQVCSYVDLLEPIQRVRPAFMWIVLGGSAGDATPLRVDEFMAYYRAAKARFESFVLSEVPPVYPPVDTYPEPVEHCGVCRWAELCVARRKADDHLSLVAGISARQRKSLAARGFDTVTRLAAAPIPFDPPLDGSSAAAVERVREQARMQVQGRDRPRPIHELVLPPPGGQIEPERGLATLPAPSAGDLFLDLEGDPYALDEGTLDYLFGILDVDQRFTPIWSFDPDGSGDVTLAGEKVAFERAVDFIIERLRAYPDMHVYHYAQYEPTALKRLMGRHATREEEVDRLLRGGVLVDLFRAVRQGLRASVESYSLKKIEGLYDFSRSAGLGDATSSIVEFEAWLELGEGERPGSPILGSIEAYNRDDVLSTLRLRDWLEEQRVRLAELVGEAVPRPATRSPQPPDALTEAAAEVAAVAAGLTNDVPADPSQRSPEDHARWLLAQLLSWHRRESKATYWDFYRRVGLTPEELVDEDGAIGQLELVSLSEPYLPTPKSRIHRRRALYRFPPQEHRDVGDRSELHDPRLAQEHAGESPWPAWRLNADLGEIDDQDSTLELIWKTRGEVHHPEAIVALNRVPDKPLPQALLRLGRLVLATGIDADGPWRAARDLLLRRAPRCGQDVGAPLRLPGEEERAAALRLVRCLERGTLAIQGPPGSGKTYLGARMIARLLADGRRVGISATSHKVIENFLRAVMKVAADTGVEIRAIQKTDRDPSDDVSWKVTDDISEVCEALASGEANVAAGTPWLWGRDDFAGAVDTLFVDEAGQISLANVVAMGGATANLVLLGDPQQLDQPLQGTHPPGADRSALAHLLDGQDTIHEHLGLFLEHTWRLHPSITRFTSAAFYEGKLASEPGLERQALVGPEPLRGAGIHLVPVEHVGNDSEAPEEARVVAAIVRTLVESGSTWVDNLGVERPLRYEDVLVVAPFNAQVGAIQRELPQARVGTVDKFQGQEAPVSIYSMTSSSPEDAPRGMPFLYSRHRLNVATSRARCVALVVAEPALLRVRARTPDEMRLANALCLFAELTKSADGGG
jgi:uncharacterized protein